jgi:hypothetical protein
MKNEDLVIKSLMGEVPDTNIQTRMTKHGRRHMNDFPKVLRQVAMECKPVEFRYNYWTLKYTITDEFGCFCLKWTVYDGVTGRKKEFFNKDFVNKCGQVSWQQMAKAMRFV